MAMTTCGECGKEISTTAKACPHCGASMSNTTGKILKVAIFVLLGLIVLVFVGIVVGSSPEAQEKQRARDIISICWADQSKKSLNAVESQSIASVCEKLESEYERKYGSRP